MRGRSPAGAASPHPLTPSPTRGEGEQDREGEQLRDRWRIPPGLQERMKQVAREFRKEPTESEALLWAGLRDRKLDGRKFRRQQPIGAFVVDFFCASERLVVEVDGPLHEFQQEHDQQRQQVLETLGLRFLRISSVRVEKDLAGALNLIREALTSATVARPHPEAVPPLPSWERGLGGEGKSGPHPEEANS